MMQGAKARSRILEAKVGGFRESDVKGKVIVALDIPDFGSKYPVNLTIDTELAKQLPPVGQTCRLEMYCGDVKKDKDGNEKAKDKPYNYFWDILSVKGVEVGAAAAAPPPAVTQPAAQTLEMRCRCPTGTTLTSACPPPPAGGGKGDFQPPEVQFQLASTGQAGR